MLSSVLAIFLSVAAGVAGWFGTHFIGRPIVKFYEIRSASIEAMHFTASARFLDPTKHGERIEIARTELRRCASRLVALQHDASPSTARYLRWRGYDIDLAAKGLTGLSNSIIPEVHPWVFQASFVERGFRLPLTHTSEELKTYRKLDELREPD